MKNVLVVDDNPIVRRHLRGLLERDGCVVSEAADGLRALNLIDERSFDVMFLDLNMPTLDGAGVLLGLSERKKRVPVILITSSDSSSEIVKAFKLGAKDYLLKPFGETQLRRALQGATGFDPTTVHRARFDLALVDRNEDFAQHLRSLLGASDALTHIEQMTQVPEQLSTSHQLILVGGLDAAANAEEDEAEAIGDIAARRDPSAALVRLLQPGHVLPEVTVFHAGVQRGDDGALKRLVRAIKCGDALSSGPLVRALAYDGPSDLAHLYWWTLRHSLDRALEHAVQSGTRASVDLSLCPSNDVQLNGLVDQVLEFGNQHMVEIAVVREPVAAPPPPSSPDPASRIRVLSPPAATTSSTGATPPAPLARPIDEAVTRVQASGMREVLKYNTRAPRPSAPAPMGDVPSPFSDDLAHGPVSLDPPGPAASSLAAAPTPAILIPGFAVGDLIGEGGMSRVYRATQKSLRRAVCVKIMREEFAHDPALSDRFQDEGIALATLRHPNIVSVLDVGKSDDGQLFMVMEYVEGGDLRGLIQREERLPVRAAVDLALQLLSGLIEAHGHGIIHRDLKPSNVLLTSLKDGSKLVKLVDFGIAKLMEGLKLRSGQTRVGTVVGTPGYMAPEQLLGMEVSCATDLYAVGIILFELVTGRRPFVARDEFELAQLTMMTPVPHLREFGTDVPDALDGLINALLAKNPKDRPQDAADVRATLSAISLPAAA